MNNFDFELFSIDELLRQSRVDSMQKNSNFNENEHMNDLKNVHELNVIKFKNQFQNFKNKKNVMIKTKKKIVKFTKCNVFEIELAKISFQTKIKRIKKIIN